jgi:hypothetical protein
VQLFSKIQDRLVSLIDESTESLKIAVTWFTNHDIFNAILKKLENPGFKVELIVLNDKINNKQEGVNFQRLIDLKGDFYYCEVESMVHHKFCIIDEKFVVTGSYNWTYYAENRNWENVVVINEGTIVRAYVEEFNKVINCHSKVYNIASKQRLSTIDTNNYLQTDYVYQAQKEKQKGNDLKAAKILTEILRINHKQDHILKERNEILKKYNRGAFEVSPVEIGILFQSGYTMVIPAFTQLPIRVIKGGNTTVNDQKGISVTIQMRDYIPKTILNLSLKDIKPSPANTLKIEHKLTLDKSGLLTVYCKEVDGYNRTDSKWTNLKDWL